MKFDEGNPAYSPVPRLRVGDTVAVVATSGPAQREELEAGVAVLAKRYRLLRLDGEVPPQRYLAAPDDHRRAALQRALDDDEVRAVIATRGGYGVARLLPGLRLRTGKPVVGFSDLTALHAALQCRGVRSLHGPVVTQLGCSPPEVAARLFDALEGAPLEPLQGTWASGFGTAEGPLLGGNLSVLTRLIGTPYFPSTHGAVLLLEDVGERPYRLDRMWTHLLQAGCLEGVAGIALGSFSQCDDGDTHGDEVAAELAASLGIPVVSGLSIGHGEVNLSVPLGARVRLDADAKTLSFLEGLSA